MDERMIVAAILEDRNAYDKLAGRLDPVDFSEQARLLVTVCSEYYKTDPSAESVERGVVKSAVSRKLSNPKHVDSLMGYLDDLPREVSGANISKEYRLLRRHRLGLELAGSLASGDHGQDTDSLVDKYRDYGVEQDEAPALLSIDDLYATVGAEHLIKLSPGVLNNHVGGGMVRGDHVVVFGRPNSGKTMFAINMASGLCKRGYKVLYFGNEEPRARTQVRFLSRLGKEKWSDLRKHIDIARRAEKKALKNGYENLTLVHDSGGQVAALEAAIRRTSPDVVFVDQLRNIKASNEGRVMELDTAARVVREMGTKHNALMVSMTQSGDSGEEKLALGMSDVDFSKTGIPGACDLMIGIGVTAKYKAANRRMLSLCKNKYDMDGQRVVVFIDAQHNLFTSRPPRRKDK